MSEPSRTRLRGWAGDDGVRWYRAVASADSVAQWASEKGVWVDGWMDGGDGGELEPMHAEGRQHCCRVDRDARRESSVAGGRQLVGGSKRGKRLRC